ncbi:MAG: pyridoxal phosphate-dependent aminotransferase [Thermoanaerobaculia bacterium]|nr:pyridoxal phosphate-dependent aminotransferase [Thermoanaerobaculia bacterium]
MIHLPARRAPDSSIRAAGLGDSSFVNLALGEPSWPLPAPACRALRRIERCGYGAHEGEQALRREIAAYEGVSEEEVLVTAGAQAALFAVAQTYLGPGDAALVPSPGFPAYGALTELAGARAVPYPLIEASQGLEAGPLIELLRRTTHVKLLFLNHPGNPTGCLVSEENLRRIAEACEERGVQVVADEVYRELRCPPFPRSPVSLRTVSDKGFLVGSLSKAWAAPGLRVGWLVGDPGLLAPCRAFHAAMTSHAATTSQAAALALLQHRHAILRSAREHLAERWDALDAAWQELTGQQPVLSRTGLYHWFPVGEDDATFCRKARNAGVALVPGSAFGQQGRGHVRLSAGASPDAIRDGVHRLAGLVPISPRSAA